MRETSRPVRPSLVYSMLAVLHPALLLRERDPRVPEWENLVFGGLFYSPLEAISRGTEGSNPPSSSGEAQQALSRWRRQARNRLSPAGGK
jgi:hypothetical protein